MPDQNVPLDESPSRRVEIAVERFGERDVVERAVALLAGANVGEEFLLFVGGKHAQGLLDGAPALYWPELWGARALLTAWSPSAEPAVVAGLTNQAWRVREMCARVVAKRQLAAIEPLTALLGDEVARVRAAAALAFGVVGDYEQGAAVRRLLDDPEIEVRRAAGEALRQRSVRLGRPIE